MRKVFFSFHFDRDAWRVSQVRNAGVFLEKTPFLDRAAWEEVKRRGDGAIQGWIDDNLAGTSVTCVLIGHETWKRPWVRYEIEQSYAQGKGLLGVRIHNLLDRHQRVDPVGLDPFDQAVAARTALGFVSVSRAMAVEGRPIQIYDWSLQKASRGDASGATNLAEWVEAAARAAGR